MNFVFNLFKKLSVILLITGFALPVQASENEFGLGIVAGSPTGVTAKYWSDKRTAIDMAIDWSTSGSDKFYLHVDYLLHDYKIFQPRELKNEIAVYYGVGIALQFVDNTQGAEDVSAIRIPLGLSYFILNKPIELFVEAIPLVEISPDSNFAVKSAIGARYYF